MMSALKEPVGKDAGTRAYGPTGGLYTLFAEDPFSVEPVSLVPDAVDAAHDGGQREVAVTELSGALAATVKRWTSGEFLAALMAGAVVSVPAPTPTTHIIVVGSLAYPRVVPELAVPELSDAVKPPIVVEGPPAYRAFKDLGGWLNVGDDRVADMLGIGRTTPYTWKRDGREPRPENARRIYEYHAVLDSLHRSLGSSGFTMWLRDGTPSRRERLLAGDLASLDRDVHAVVFQRATSARPDLGWAPEPTSEPVASEASGASPRRAGRRPRRARLT